MHFSYHFIFIRNTENKMIRKRHLILGNIKEKSLFIHFTLLECLYTLQHSKLTHIAAELIVERANAEKEHMGLTTWDDATI